MSEYTRPYVTTEHTIVQHNKRKHNTTQHSSGPTRQPGFYKVLKNNLKHEKQQQKLVDSLARSRSTMVGRRRFSGRNSIERGRARHHMHQEGQAIA
jgi:hypothetical protein